jgi:hypothetical protein
MDGRYPRRGVAPSGGTATDVAGNATSTEFGPIRIDKTPPEICLTTPGAIIGTPGPDT